MFHCSLIGGGLRCVQSSQEFYIYCTSACSNAPSLGAAYGGRIPSSSFSASSKFGVTFLPEDGRLHSPRGGWAAARFSPVEYLQIDLGDEYWVCGVATQGEGRYTSDPDSWPQSTSSTCPWTTATGKSTSGTVQIRWVLSGLSHIRMKKIPRLFPDFSLT